MRQMWFMPLESLRSRGGETADGNTNKRSMQGPRRCAWCFGSTDGAPDHRGSAREGLRELLAFLPITSLRISWEGKRLILTWTTFPFHVECYDLRPGLPQLCEICSRRERSGIGQVRGC